MEPMTWQHVENGPRRARRTAALGAVLAGGAAALLVAVAGSHSFQLTALSFGAVTGTTAAFVRAGEGEFPIWPVVFGLAGGAVAASRFPTPPVAAMLGGLVWGTAWFDIREKRDAIEAALLSGAAAGAAAFTTGTLFRQGFLQPVDVTGLREMLTAGIWGVFLAAAMGLRHVRCAHDPIRARLDDTAERLPEDADGYVREARKLYHDLRPTLERARGNGVCEEAERIVEETVRALISLAERGATLRAALEAHSDGELEGRRAALNARLETADQRALRSELEAAREELAEQARERDGLVTALERVDLRQERCLSALRRLHVRLVENGRGDERSDERLSQSLDQLNHLTEQLEWQNLSVEEICRRADEGAGSV